VRDNAMRIRRENEKLEKDSLVVKHGVNTLLRTAARELRR
jgi:hypothetical protein